MSNKSTAWLTSYVHAGCLILTALLLGACEGMLLQPVYEPPPAAPAPRANFPNGVITYLNDQGIPETFPLNVAFHITVDPGFIIKDSTAAHETVPKLFLQAMNSRLGNSRFVEANGTPGHIQITLSFFMDSTQDHGGVHVTVVGFAASENIRTGGNEALPWFSFDLQPYYIGLDTLVNAAANKTMDYIIRGWADPRSPIPATPQKQFPLNGGP